MFNRQEYVRSLIESGVEIDAAMREELADEFDCKPKDIANEVYRIKNPYYWRKYKERLQISSENGRAREAGAKGCLFLDDWRRLCNLYGGACASCGRTELLVIDHVIPLSKGGSNTIDNIQPLCLDCNRKKSNRYADYRTIKLVRDDDGEVIVIETIKEDENG